MQRKALYVLLLIGLIAAPFVGVYPVFMMKVLCFALFAAAFNLLIGYTGLLSFGHAMFLASAGYTTGYVIQTLGFTPEVGVIAGTAVATALGLVVGLFAIRRQGIYFAMVTLALAQMVYFIFLQAPFTHGEDGLQGVPRGKLFGIVDLGSDLTLYYVVLVVMVLAFALIVRIVHSPFGQVLVAIKENEPRAISLGYDGALQAAGVRAVGGARGAGGSDEDGRARLRDARRRLLDDVGPRRADDARRRHGHDVRAGAGRGDHRRAGKPARRYRHGYRADHGRRLVQFAGRIGNIVTGLMFIACVLAFRRGIVGEIIARVRPLQG